jgi:hypothetical protein
MAEAQKQEELPLEVDNEEVEVDLQETKEEVKVEEVEDTKEPETEEAKGLDGYSKKVRARIEEMTYKIREAERREKAAIEYAQGLQKENKQLQERSKTIDDSYLKEYDARVSSEEATLKTKLAEAISAGDVEAQVNINKDLARLAVEAGELNKAKVTREQQAKLVEQQPEAQQAPQQAPKPVHPKAQAWAEKNTWFGSDDPMTLTAFSIHNDLIKQYGEQYALTDEYYTTIDQKIREAFPHKFVENTPQNTFVNTPVAPATRSSGAKNPKKVTLTKSEVAIAKKLGVSLEQYARQKQNLATT